MKLLAGAAAGYILSCQITMQQPWQLHVFGSNNSGQLGLGDELNRQQATPQQRFVFVDARKSVSAGITADGRIQTWGKSSHGILGHKLERNINITLPTDVHADQPFKHVSCGERHMAAVTLDGQLYVWGTGSIMGVAPSREAVDMRERKKIELYSNGILPSRVDLGVRVKQVVCGGDHTLALTEDGQVYSWGAGKGVGRIDSPHTPGRIASLPRITQVAAAKDFSLAVDEKGRVYGWGNNNFSQLGFTEKRILLEPVATGLENVNCISAG